MQNICDVISQNRLCDAILLMGRIFIPFDRTFNFNLRAKKDRCRSANFQRDFRLLGIVLYVRRITWCNQRMLVFRFTWFCVAWFLTCWLNAWTELIAPFHFMFLCHYLLTLHSSLLHPTTTRSENSKWRTNWCVWLFCFIFKRKMVTSSI